MTFEGHKSRGYIYLERLFENGSSQQRKSDLSEQDVNRCQEDVISKKAGQDECEGHYPSQSITACFLGRWQHHPIPDYLVAISDHHALSGPLSRTRIRGRY